MVPTEPPPRGSIIESPLFRAFDMCHPCTYGVYFESTFEVPLQCFIHRHIKFLPFYSSLAYSNSTPSLSNPCLSHRPSPLESSQSLPGQPLFIMLWKGKLLVYHPSCSFPSSSLVSVHHSLYYVPSCLCWGFLIASTLAGSLMSTSAHWFQKSSLEGSVPWFQLPSLFSVSVHAKGLIISLWLGCFSHAWHQLLIAQLRFIHLTIWFLIYNDVNSYKHK